LTLSAIRRRVVESAGLGDVIDRALRGARLSRDALLRVLECGSPLAAAALADARRAATSDVVVTHPWTLRVRAPGHTFAAESAMLVSHPLARVGGITASEAQLVGIPTSGLTLTVALDLTRGVRDARPGLPIRAFTASQVRTISASERMTDRQVVEALAGSGVATLDWSPGDGLDDAAIAVHRAAHEAGMKTVLPVAYTRGALTPEFLDRLEAYRRVAEDTQGFLSCVVLPNRTAGASPLDGTSGSEDTMACAIARLAFGHVVPRVTVDAHVVGHKLGALLLSAGADDFVGAQAAAAWAAPTDDGPRPLNPDRVRRHLIEARRSPELRNALFLHVNDSCA